MIFEWKRFSMNRIFKFIGLRDFKIKKQVTKLKLLLIRISDREIILPKFQICLNFSNPSIFNILLKEHKKKKLFILHKNINFEGH